MLILILFLQELKKPIQKIQIIFLYVIIFLMEFQVYAMEDALIIIITSDNIMIDINTFQNCPSGGILIQFKFELQTTILNINKYHFINNSVNDASFN